MKQLLPIASSLLLLGGLSAQTISGKTASDFGNAIKAGTNTDSDSEKKDTAIGARGLGAFSSIRGAGSASSSARVGKSSSWRTGTTTWSASVADRGHLSSDSTSNDSSANTTGDGGKAGAHSVDFMFGATKDTKGTLSVYVSAGASTGGTATASVTVAGKTYSVKAGDRPMRISLDFTLTSKGLPASVSTSGSCALKGRGRANYGAHASVSFTTKTSTGGGKCTVTEGTKGCGPVLKGTASSGSTRYGPSVKLELSGAAKGSIGLLLYSDDGKTVDIGGCPLFSSVVHAAAFTTSSTGTKTQTLRFPRSRDIKVSVGHVILSFTSTGITFKSSNTLDIVCTSN